MGKNQIEVKEPPTLLEIEEFWRKIWEEEKTHNGTAEWIKKEEERTSYQTQQEWRDIQKSEVTIALRKASNWKSPGVDKIAKWRPYMKI